MRQDIKAYAKINLHLQVGNKNKDGFHNIVSIIQKISLSDDISLEVIENNGFDYSITGLEGICENNDSTVSKAIILWQEKTNFQGTIKVSVNKNIPVRAGLGGGSSDAASTLLALENATGNKLSYEELFEIAYNVGKDVPFFLSDAKAAIVTGNGDKIKAIMARTDLNGFVVKTPFEKSSTKDMYSHLDKIDRTVDFRDINDLIQTYFSNVSDWDFVNDFEKCYENFSIETNDDEKFFLTGSGSYKILISDKQTIKKPTENSIGFNTNI